MAIFFIASGYCYKEYYSDDIAAVRRYIKRKIATLWFPYTAWTILFSVLHNYFIKINIYTDNPLITEYLSGKYIDTTEKWNAVELVQKIVKACLFRGGTQIGGALWFLATLFEISILYCIIDFVIKRICKSKKTRLIQLFISVVFVCIGYACYLTGRSLFGIDKVFSCYILYSSGNGLKKLVPYCKKYINDMSHVVFLIISFFVLFILNKFGTISIVNNSYENPVFLLCASYAGWIFCYEAAYLVQKCNILKKCAMCIGQNTLIVVALHFLCFKLVNFIGAVIKRDPFYLIAAFPILYRGDAWWIGYSCAGLMIPIGCSLLWKKLKHR